MTDLNKLEKLLERSMLSDNTLWDMNDIAAYMRLSKSTVQQRVINITGFPRAIKLPTTDNGGQRRWQPNEVKAWAKRYREVA